VAVVASPFQPYVEPDPQPTQPPSKPLHERLLPRRALAKPDAARVIVALGRTTHKIHLVDRLNARRQVAEAAPPAPSSIQKPPLFAKIKTRSFMVGASIVVILAVTGYISFDTWRTNNLAKEAFASGAATTESPLLTADQRQKAEGKDESALPKNALTSYRVAPNLPRGIYIDKLNIAARVLPMGVNADGSMQAPLGIYDAGWYSGSVRPGETGAMVLNGHSSGPTRQGLFGRLDTLKVGDEVVLEKGDMVRLKYKVMLIETVPLAEVDMHKVSLPFGTAASGLNIYTCTGKWLPEKNTFDHRTIVYTAQVK
jgi:LPXTG-site transpeptidase (sortase) family protein